MVKSTESDTNCRNSVTADRVTSGSRTRTLPPRPPGAGGPPPTSTTRTSSSSMKQTSSGQSGSMLNISKMSSKSASSRGHGHSHHDADIFYSSDSELGGGHKVRCSNITFFNYKHLKSPEKTACLEKKFKIKLHASTNDLQISSIKSFFTIFVIFLSYQQMFWLVRHKTCQISVVLA